MVTSNNDINSCTMAQVYDVYLVSQSRPTPRRVQWSGSLDVRRYSGKM